MSNSKDQQSGLDKVIAEAASRIEAVDEALREQFTGQPALSFVGAAGEAFSAVGVTLSPTDVRAYAESVSSDQPFETP